MKILSSEFITSATSKNNTPKRKLLEVAIVGRSNVGKSSLINALLNRKIAKTSATPGKTRLLNYFLINDAFYIVDLPGYGYAKVSKEEQEKWRGFIENYFKDNLNLALILQLIDIRHELKDNDKQMLDFIQYFNLPYIIVLTKADKLNQSELKKQIAYYQNIAPECKIVVTSAEKGLGKKELLSSIAEGLQGE